MGSEKKESIIMHFSQYQVIESIGLSYEEKGRLFSAIFEFYMNGATDCELSAKVSVAFEFIKKRIEEDRQHYLDICERRSKAALHRESGKRKTDKGNDINNEHNDHTCAQKAQMSTKSTNDHTCAQKAQMSTKSTNDHTCAQKAQMSTKSTNDHTCAQKAQMCLSDTDTDTDTDTDVTNVTSINILSDSSFQSESVSDFSSDELAEEINPKLFVDFFNSEMKNAVIPKINRIQGKRLNALLARKREYGMEAVEEAVRKAAASDFMNGKNDRGWVANFDWMFLPNNFPKVHDGNYDNHTITNNYGRREELCNPRGRYETRSTCDEDYEGRF